MTDQSLPEEKPSNEHRFRWANIGIFFSTLATIIFICAFAYGYFQLSKVNIALADQLTLLQNKLITNDNQIASLQQSTQTLQASLQKSAELSAEQEKLVSEWRAAQKGDLEKWQVAEAQYLVNLANDHLQFTHHLAMTTILLQRADQILQALQDPRLLPIRQSLAADLTRLQSAPVVNVTSLYVQLSGLNHELDQLPLPSHPLKAEEKPVAEPVMSQTLPWWKAGWAYSWQALSKIIVIRKTETNALPLVMPDEKLFLFQNLHAQMENAMWAVLHRNSGVYQASLLRMQAWIQQYFDQESDVTKSMLQNMSELQKINLQPPAANLSATLQLFDQYFKAPS